MEEGKINPWLETIGVIFIALLGVLLGKLSSCFRKPYWAWGYLVPTILISMLVLTRFYNTLFFTPPFSWVTAGRTRFIVLAFAVTMGLTAPLSRLPRRCEKLIVGVLMAIVVGWFSVMPFLVPALIKDALSNLTTTINSNGICYQSTDYTCGPAAAVTALRKLGLSANEGELAVLSYTSPVVGTLPTCLSSALQERYGTEGLKSQYRYFDSITQLRNAGITLAVIKDGFMNSHCVTVLGVSDYMVTIADPVVGRMLMSRKQFEKVWRFSGIVLKRDSTQNI
jgi:predicted double-glycine peptidase